MSYVQPRDLWRANAPMVHAANVVYVLNEIRVRRGDLAAAGVLWGRVVRVGGVVSVGSACVLEVGVLVGGRSGPGAFRNVSTPRLHVTVLGARADSTPRCAVAPSCELSPSPFLGARRQTRRERGPSPM